jgi:hypothetical protein
MYEHGHCGQVSAAFRGLNGGTTDPDFAVHFHGTTPWLLNGLVGNWRCCKDLTDMLAVDGHGLHPLEEQTRPRGFLLWSSRI